MRIGYDAKRAINNMTGLGNYSRLIIESVAEAEPHSRLLLYTPALKPNERLHKINGLRNIEIRLPDPSGLKGSLWRSYGITKLLKKDRIDIYHGLSNELPLNISSAAIPSVVTMHDVIYRRIPEDYNLIDRKIYDYKYGKSCRAATRIIAISEKTKRDIVELYGVSPDKIDVVYQGCDASFRKPIDAWKLEETRDRLLLPEKYLLQVGTVESRKNLELSVRALPSIPSDIVLVAVGRDRKGYKKRVEEIATELGVRERVIFRDEIRFADLPAVNRMAELVLYPSRYEGFGIPVLEAIASGKAVVAARGSCLEEAGGEGALYVDPNNPRQLAEAVNTLLGDKEKLTETIRKGEEHLARFDNTRLARTVLDVYEKALSDYRP